MFDKAKHIGSRYLTMGRSLWLTVSATIRSKMRANSVCMFDCDVCVCVVYWVCSTEIMHILVCVCGNVYVCLGVCVSAKQCPTGELSIDSVTS